ncbi:hypothetical protein [Hymenobacter volaticus]|uniref:Uncharacterized protein n=1 Tax=Hymenobacter volaticus TaxID=2932254 RepID=A0ABY4GEP6_9BACT|nr:hypothetical protein [Hymenobacter volaticus]UOQ69287.1 hypothetical protein MUN86_27945 [Hymenobacter volaticus]UOQ69317.1 hypothetical protein MUN86_26845 [Hymenobacter volaticus]
MPIGCFLLLLFSGILTASRAQGQVQEYIINGDFETMSSCPIEPGEIRLATGWQGNEGTPDYLHTCSEQRRDSVDVLRNFSGYRKAYEGEGQAGLYLLHYNTTRGAKENYASHEVIYTKLSRPLTVGKTYHIRFFLSLADSSGIASDSIYVSFSRSPSFTKHYELVEPDVSKGIAVARQHTWQVVEADFTATEPFSYCYLGLPRRKVSRLAYRTIIGQGLQAGRLQGRFVLNAYYFIDNVSLTERE